jgi:hypothetical protein
MSAVIASITFLAQSGYGSANEWTYVLAGWGLVAGGIAAYALAIARKGRKLSKDLPPDERRWTS